MSWAKENLRRSYPCNVDVFTHLREQRCWTQRELADAAGYSERLICKAEAGKALSAASIEAIAHALSTPKRPVYPEDLISDPLHLAKSFFNALYMHQTNAVEAIRKFLDPDIIYHIPGNQESIPFAGTYYGIKGFQRAIEKFFSVMEVPPGEDFEPWYTFMSRGNEVIVWGNIWIHPVDNPMEKPMIVASRMKFRRGKLYEVQDCFDTSEIGVLLNGVQHSTLISAK